MRYIEDDLKDIRILVTGGGGFIGSNILKYLVKEHPAAQLACFDHFSSGKTWPSGNPEYLGSKENVKGLPIDIIQGDFKTEEGLKAIIDWQPAIIFHQAAISDTTVEDREVMFETNVYAFERLMNHCSQKNIKLIYASSAGTYGNSEAPNKVGKGETPTNVYGESKLAMDTLTRAHLDDFKDGQIVGLRYFNVYGPGEWYKGRTASMILQLGKQVMESGKVRLFEFGEQLRDFVYIDDVVQANIRSIQAQQSGIYNVGLGKSRSFNDIVEVLKDELGTFEVEYFKNPYTFYQNHTEADIMSTAEHLSYQPKFELEDAVKAYVEQLKSIEKTA